MTKSHFERRTLYVTPTEHEAALLRRILPPGDYAISVGGALSGRGFERVIADFGPLTHEPKAEAWFQCSAMTRLTPGGRACRLDQ